MKIQKLLLCLLSRKLLWLLFVEFAWEVCAEKWRGFLVSFSWSPFSHETKRENSSKNLGKLRSKIRGQNSGRKFEKFGECSFCNFSDLRNCSVDQEPNRNGKQFTLRAFKALLSLRSFRSRQRGGLTSLCLGSSRYRAPLGDAPAQFKSRYV